MPRGEKAQLFPSGPLFQRLDAKGPGARASFARAMNVSQPRLTNWRKRGVPAAELPRVAAGLGMTVEQYLAEGGKPNAARQDLPVYVVDHERQLLERYRASSPSWQLTLRLLASLAPADQEMVAQTLNAILTRLSSEGGKLVPRTKVGQADQGSLTKLPDRKRRSS